MSNPLNIPLNHRSLTRSLAATLAVAGFLAFASGSAMAACPTFESVGWHGMTQKGYAQVIDKLYGGDWQAAVAKWEHVTGKLIATGSPKAEKYEKRVSLVRCLAESQTGKQSEQASR